MGSLLTPEKNGRVRILL
uniref:Uncharacterized protein n=1 Tax=Anguilla anguilla TaxID=7936 RepID=A0A0E9SYJ9_ANGAN